MGLEFAAGSEPGVAVLVVFFFPRLSQISRNSKVVNNDINYPGTIWNEPHGSLMVLKVQNVLYCLRTIR